MENNLILKKNIQRLRKLKNLRQFDLAELVGCSLGTIRDIEAMNTKPSLDMLGKIARALNVQSADLLYYEKEKDNSRETLILEAISKIQNLKDIENIKQVLTTIEILSESESRKSKPKTA